MRSINTESQKGAITILMAVVLVGLIGIAAFAIDIGYGLVVKSELQNVADTGSLAGTRALALAYQTNGTYWGETPTSDVKSTVLSKVNTITQKNEAGGMPIVVGTSDIVLGKYNKVSEDVDAVAKGALAVKVIARRDATSNGPIATTLARVFGITSLQVAAQSAATLSALKKAPPGKLGIPVGISEYWFKSKNGPCANSAATDHNIRLYPTGPQAGENNFNAIGCAGWHTYEDYPANASTLRDILKGLKNGSYKSPETEAFADSFIFIGGAVATAFNDFKTLYESSKSSDGTWTTVIPVYKSSSCANPGGPIQIVGFATVYIYNVKLAPSPTIDGKIVCNVVDWGEGGGDDYGTLVGQPGMVQ
jgi:Flp pilus assembly protein TadG